MSPLGQTAEYRRAWRALHEPRVPCPACGTRAKPPGRRYCSDECAAEGARKGKRASKVRSLLPCEWCGGEKPHVFHAGMGKGVRYCSDACREAGKRRQRAQQNAKNKKLSDEAKLTLGCSSCGYKKSPRALHWHHVDPSQKTLMIRGGSHLKTGKLAEERDSKCILLCANRHYESHDTTLA